MSKQQDQSVQDWLNNLTIDHSATSVTSYEWQINRLIKTFPGREIKDLSKSDLLKYFADWKRARISDVQIKMSMNALRSFYQFTVGEKAPIFEIRIPRPKKRLQRTLSKEQALALLETCDTGTPIGTRNVAMVALMLDSGLRVSEVCRLNINDLDLEHCRLSVIVKGGDEDCGVFSVETANFLSRWVSYRAAYAKVDNVFVGFEGHRIGEPLTVYGMRTLFRRLGLAAGIPAFSPHDLRRTFATIASKLGAPTRLVQIAGRWHDITQVEQYTRALNQEDFAPYSPVSGVMRGM